MDNVHGVVFGHVLHAGVMWVEGSSFALYCCVMDG